MASRLTGKTGPRWAPDAPSRILARGSFLFGSQDRVQDWVGSTTQGALGIGPLYKIGPFDLRPWEGFPPGASVDYREAITAVDSGEGRVRFTAQHLISPMNVISNVQYGTGSLGEAFTAYDDSANQYVHQCLPTWISAWDTVDSQSDQLVQWNNGANVASILDWQTALFQEPNAASRFIEQGPDLAASLAGNTSIEWDLGQLGGGARFVCLWFCAAWQGNNAFSRNFSMQWQVENRAGQNHYCPLTLTFPVLEVQDYDASAVWFLENERVVAQANLTKWAGMNYSYTTGGSFRCMVSNGGGACEVATVPYIGTMPDTNLTILEQGVASASVAAPSLQSVAQTGMIGPYSYVNVAAQKSAPAGNRTGPLLISLCIG